MRVVGLTIHPLKSACGVAVGEAEVEPRGLKGDRRWMLVDSDGRLVSQRDLPALARLIAEPHQAGLKLAFDGEAIEIAAPEVGSLCTVSVWRDIVPALEAVAAAGWLTRKFGRPLRLVRQPDEGVRPVSADWGRPQDQVSFADGFPLLVATRESLAAVEAEIGAPLGMERFRPNLVIAGAAAWEEDAWTSLRIGEVELDLVKPCARCVVTTVDQERGAVAGGEPLDALRRLRLSGDRRVPGVLFGWNTIPRKLGRIRVGDSVEIVARRTAWAIQRRV